MLDIKNRLRNKKDIEKVFKSGRSLKEGTLLLRVLKNNLTESRIGFVVSQKVAKKAVVRNKVKRRLRALIIKRLQNIKSGVDLLFITLPGTGQKNYSYLEENVDRLLIKSGYSKK